METTAWNSSVLQIAYTLFGWTAFFFWSCSFYPQVLLNFFRKSVVGLNFNYVVLNNTKHTLYFLYNVTLYFSPAVRFQYHKKYGFDQMIPVAANDVAFSTHAILVTAFLLLQTAMYERGNQSISKVTIGIVSAVWIAIAVCFFVALHSNAWLWLISIFNTMQVVLAVIKYVPQAAMNFVRKSTEGFGVGNVLLDFSGGVTNYAQMVTQSIDQNSWVNFSGNIGKVLLSLVSMFFDLLFLCQHYVFYPSKKKPAPMVEPLIQPPHQSVPPNEPLVPQTV
ncbi:hypothetical protein L6164_005027 [Bauhinia variegata]|uniref:Uncharacterized protein n=1 Tax=Bauhinia variegata TaxID=167791 RepID=A0ACB9PQI8_BAUVA|nr:hypothetical protein L6164_005027 [Bauhinia variegata]